MRNKCRFPFWFGTKNRQKNKKENAGTGITAEAYDAADTDENGYSRANGSGHRNSTGGICAMRAGLGILAVAATANAAFISYAANLSDGTQSYRNRVIDVSGISDLNDLSSAATRASFAKMLVKSSSYKDAVGTTQIAAANDVPATSEDAGYVRVALRNGWMRTRLGGNFAPDGAVTLNDAAKAVLTLLGYTDSDFTGDVTEGRLALFKSLKLNDGIKASAGTDTLTKQDCLNIIYNLLKATPKNGNAIYGTALDLSLDSNGEINATDLMELNMTGPILVKNMTELREALPFELEGANLYYNGQTPGSSQYGIMYYESQLNSQGWMILYYNEASKTVWAYGRDTGDNTYHCIKGTVEAIYYTDDNVVTPSSVAIDGTTYSLNNADVKFMFSINGDIKVGDEVVLITKDNTQTDSDGNELTNYYAIGVVLYNRNNDGSTTGTSFPQDVTRYTATKDQSGISSQAGSGSSN